MRSSSQNKSSREAQPLHFELVANREEAYQVISKLRRRASRIFTSVSKVFRLFDEACLPSGIEDPLLEPKIMGRGLLIRNHKLLTVAPESIIGFGFLLPTDRVAHIGLATYPSKALSFGKLVDVPFENHAVWSGIMNTFMKRCEGCRRSCNVCIDSHVGACELLQEAEDLGVLQDVKDSTDFWTTRSTDSLVQLCRTMSPFCTLSVRD